MAVSVLNRKMFTEAEAARLLRVAQGTLNYWLEGGQRRGKVYRPVIRVEPRGHRDIVTWAEFVEAGLLREYRRTYSVPMAELRAFTDGVRRMAPSRRSPVAHPDEPGSPFRTPRGCWHQHRGAVGARAKRGEQRGHRHRVWLGDGDCPVGARV